MPNHDTLDLKNLRVISALGRGAKGVVFLVEIETGELLALKSILRASVEKKKKKKNDNDNNNNNSKENDYKRIWLERQVLSSLHHPLLPSLRGSLSTDKIVGYAIDYCSGGDLNSLRAKQTEKMFSDDVIRFYAAELVLALEYLHGLGIVYRDLKPENVMIQENGHIMLVDFDLSTKLSPKTPKNDPIHHDVPKKSMPIRINKKKKLLQFQTCCNSGISPTEDSVHSAEPGTDSVSNSESESVEKSNSFVGTEEYVAPEVILGSGHDFSVDWWCLGVMLYEMLYGTTPFRGSDRKDTFYRVLTYEPRLTGEQTALRDLIRKLLEKDPQKRISVDEIKRHNFFNGVDWGLILDMPRPPFIPDVRDTDGNTEIDVEKYVQQVFKDKVGINNDDEKIEKEKGGEVVERAKNNNYGVWVQGLNHPTHQPQNDHFLVF